MSKFIIPRSFALHNCFPEVDSSATKRSFTMLSRLYNADGIHVGMCFDADTGMNSKFQFEISQDVLELTEEGRIDQIWTANIEDVQIELPNIEGEYVELKGLSVEEQTQAVLNCLGNAFDQTPNTDVSLEEANTYEIMDSVETFVPGSSETRSLYKSAQVKKTLDAGKGFDGSVSGAKTVVCLQGDEIIQTLTGTARICADRSLAQGSLFSWLSEMKKESSLPTEFGELLESFPNDAYFISVTSRKNDGTTPGGTVGVWMPDGPEPDPTPGPDPDPDPTPGPDPDPDFDAKRKKYYFKRVGKKIIGDDSINDIKDFFKAIFGKAIEYQQVVGSGDASGLPSSDTQFVEIEAPMISAEAIDIKYKGDVSSITATITSPDFEEDAEPVTFKGDYDPESDVTTFSYDISTNIGQVTQADVSLSIAGKDMKVYRSSSEVMSTRVAVVEVDPERSINRAPGELFTHRTEEMLEGVEVGSYIQLSSNHGLTNMFVQVSSVFKEEGEKLNDDGEQVPATYYNYTFLVISGKNEEIKTVKAKATYEFTPTKGIRPRLGDKVKIKDAALEDPDKEELDNSLIRLTNKYNIGETTEYEVDFLLLTSFEEDEWYGTVMAIDGGGGSASSDISGLEARVALLESAITITP